MPPDGWLVKFTIIIDEDVYILFMAGWWI